MSLWSEIRRRNVHRVAIAYVAAAWLLIQVVETLFPVFGLSDSAIRAVVLILAIGLVPAVILSWVFEWTPEGIQHDDGAAAATPTSRSRTFDAAIIAMLVIAVAYFAVDKFVFDPARDAEEREEAEKKGRTDALIESYGDKSIVVLPFVNISSDPEQEYLGDGLAEELLNLLARVQGLRVISRTSAFSFKDIDITTSEIAQQLNVSYVLEGSVRKSGDTLRITAQLIDARVDSHVWSETYDHAARNIFDIQDSVAGEVVGHLMTELALKPPKAERHNPAAYALYLQARQLSNRAGTNAQQRELLERALELEPNFLDAKVKLAWTHRIDAMATYRDGNREEADGIYEYYRSLIDEVLAQDPGNPIANSALAWDMFQQPDYPAAAAYTEAALASEPTHFEALTTAGEFLVRLWREEQAIQILEYAAERDPLNSYHFENIAKAYLNAGRPKLAEEAYRTVLILSQDDIGWAAWGVGLALLMQGKASEALEQFDENIMEQHPLRLHGMILALHDLDRIDEAQTMLTRIIEGYSDMPNIEWVIGSAYAWMDENNQAFEFFEKQSKKEPLFFNFMADSPLYKNVRKDPRWLPLLESIGLDPESRAAVKFEPTLPPEIRLQ